MAEIAVELDRPIFIVGHARGGSTLLGAFINWHSHVGPRHEDVRSSSSVDQFVESLIDPERHGRYASVLEQKEIWFDYFPGKDVFTHMGRELVQDSWTLGEARAQELKARLTTEFRERRFLSKAPSNSFRVRALKELFPDARIIALYRRGREVVSSWGRRFYGFGKEVQWGDTRIDCLGYEEGISIFARKWLETLQHLEAARRELGFLALTYDELVTEPRQTLERVFRHLELPMEDWVAGVRVVDRRDGWREGVPERHHELLAEATREGDALIDALAGECVPARPTARASIAAPSTGTAREHALRAVEQAEDGRVWEAAGSWQLALEAGLDRSQLLQAGLPGSVVLLPVFDWFGFDYARLSRELRARGLLACYLDTRVEPEGPLAGVDAGTWRQRTHHEVPLAPVSLHDLCVRGELTPRVLEDDPDSHIEAIATEYGRAVKMIDRALLYIERLEPETAVVAQGHVLASAVVRALALRRSMRLVCLENTLHAGKLLWDDVSGLTVHRNAARNIWWRVEDSVPAAEAEAFATEYLAGVRSLKSQEHATPEVALPELDSASPVIVYLAQVSTDASVLFGLGPGFKTQVDVIRSLARHAVARGHSLVVKLHPKEKEGQSVLDIPYAQLTLRQMRADPELAALLDAGDLRVDGDNQYDTYGLIARADLCVTVNSQAGLEALVMGREVVLCGGAFYGGLGFTHEADDAESLAVCVDRVLQRDVRRNDGVEPRRFFHVFLNGYCLEKSWRSLVALVGPPQSTEQAAEELPRVKDFGYESGERQTATNWAAIRRDHRVRYDLAARVVRDHMEGKPCRGLDLFCGNGYGSWLLSERAGAEVLGIDGSQEAIEVARRHYQVGRSGFEHRVFPFDLPDARFEFAVCFESIEHVEDDEVLFGSLARSLKPGGLLFLSVPNERAMPLAANKAFFGHHVRHYALEDVLRLATNSGLSPRLLTGQNAYHVEGGVVVGPCDEVEMELSDGLTEPQFHVAVFERGPI
ncbi:MAG: methyltransferase domain-containing protein [bacterium]|nr:methyltransferase domain-containing protein [bacterium]